MKLEKLIDVELSLIELIGLELPFSLDFLIND